MSIETAKSAVLLQPTYFSDGFYLWLIDNYAVFEYFERSAIQVSDKGFKHYSARTIVEVMRHRTNIREIGDGTWKLNNNRTPEMAKLFMLLHPEYRGFFEFRFKENRAA